MTTYNGNLLYKQLSKISINYFGPATDRVLEALIKNHTKKTPDTLTRGDIRKLTGWLSLSLSLVSEDEVEVKRYLQKVKRLYSSQPAGK